MTTERLASVRLRRELFNSYVDKERFHLQAGGYMLRVSRLRRKQPAAQGDTTPQFTRSAFAFATVGTTAIQSLPLTRKISLVCSDEYTGFGTSPVLHNVCGELFHLRYLLTFNMHGTLPPSFAS